MKQRFSSLDVKVIAHELNQSLVTLRLVNVYDLSSRILLFKFAKPDNKKHLVIDTGFRCHLTEFARTTAATPSGFVARLRKLLKTRRLTSVAQVGTDRILEFQFSDGQYRLFLEFFASGNIILTDADLKILTLSRNVSEADSQEQQRVGLQYSLENRQNFHGVPLLTKQRVQDALRSAAEKAAASTQSSKKLKGKSGTDLRNSLAVSITELPPVLVDHILQSNNFDTTVKPAELLEDDSRLDQLVNLLSEAKSSIEGITSSDKCTGYIFAKRRDANSVGNSTSAPSPAKRENLLYEDFHPFIPHKLSKNPEIEVLEFKGYNQTVDEFFSSLEGQKLETRLNEREAAAKRKLDAAKADQNKRIEGLQEAQTLNMRKAAAIETNVEWVQEAMDAVNGLLGQGMDWVDIGKLIEREKKRRNPVAEIIALPLNLAENRLTLNLMENVDEEEEEADPYETDDSDSDNEESAAAVSSRNEPQSPKGLQVEIDLTISPWSNAREYYEQRRTAVVKEEKTQQQAIQALKNAEQKITADLKKGLKQEKALLQPIRAQLWFEKFFWFMSSDGYLVLGGKDLSQNEILYQRHLRKGDVYCHADLRGAPIVIIKNNPSTPDAPIPPATLAQAGNLSVCGSEAWDQKAGMGAWWVNADQVSKAGPGGDYLPMGSFSIRGNKNFLPPAQLLLGLGFMFKVSEESKAKHVKHRVTSEIDSALGSEDQQSTASSIGTKDEEEQEDDNTSAEESEDDDRERGETRANPLQQFGQPTVGDEDVEEATDGISGLQVETQPSNKAGGDVEEPESPDESDVATIATEPPTQPSPSVGSTAQPSASNTANKGPTPAPAPAPPKRGQKGKAKKIASKYKFQDEEDRAAAEALIGATTGQKRQEAEAKSKADKQAELEAAKERRRAQHQRQQKEIAEHEERRRLMMDEGVDMPDADETEQPTPLDALVGTPLPGDEILEVIPVCAPWNALGKFKYKAKMQPGPSKKGKAVKEIVERLKVDSGKKGVVDEAARDSEKMWPREVELIKGLKVEEIINCVPAGKVRVMMSGGSSGGGGGKGKGGGQKGSGKSGKGGKGKK